MRWGAGDAVEEVDGGEPGRFWARRAHFTNWRRSMLTFPARGRLSGRESIPLSAVTLSYPPPSPPTSPQSPGRKSWAVMKLKRRQMDQVNMFGLRCVCVCGGGGGGCRLRGPYMFFLATYP